MIENPRHTPGTEAKDDPNLVRKEAEREKVELEEEEDADEDERDDKLEPMTERSEQQPQRLAELSASLKTPAARRAFKSSLRAMMKDAVPLVGGILIDLAGKNSSSSQATPQMLCGTYILAYLLVRQEQ